MPRKLYKHKLLLDEGFPIRKFFPRTNGRYDIKHITADLRYAGLSDPQVYETAIRTKRILITLNEKDFKKLAEKDKVGIIGVSANMSTDQIDKKLNALLSKSSKRSLFGKFISISGEGLT